MTEWEQVEHDTTQRVLGAMVGKYGAKLSEESEEQARILALVALAALKGEWERLRVVLEAARAALQSASDRLPDPMHPAFPRQFVDAQADALAIISDALAAVEPPEEQA